VRAATHADGGHAPADAATAPLVVEGLTSGYGRTTILRDVSLTVRAGGVTALIGPNGAGKTTLLRTVAGFLPASDGSISMFGEDVTRVAPFRRFAEGVCLIPEGRGIFRSLTVKDNIVMQSRPGQEDEAITRATEAFPILGKRLSQRAGTLSGGEQQMLALVASYVRDARLILVDEASLGLAPIVVDEIFSFLGGLAQRGTALLLVDQFVTRALELASDAYVLRKGTVSYSGSAEDLLKDNLVDRYIGA
jgi:branched-chain amino acid transport system ATP-binding protein